MGIAAAAHTFITVPRVQVGIWTVRTGVSYVVMSGSLTRDGFRGRVARSDTSRGSSIRMRRISSTEDTLQAGVCTILDMQGDGLHAPR